MTEPFPLPTHPCMKQQPQPDTWRRLAPLNCEFAVQRPPQASAAAYDGRDRHVAAARVRGF